MRDYAEKLTDALGAGFDSDTAGRYARGAFRLRRYPPRPRQLTLFPKSVTPSSKPTPNPSKLEDQ